MTKKIVCDPSFTLGVGINLATGRPKQIAMSNVPANPTRSDQPAVQQATLFESFKVSQATSQEQLATTMQVNTSASASYGAFSASGSVDTYNAMDFSSYGVWLTVIGNVTTHTMSFPSPTLTKDAKDSILSAAGGEVFAGSYGHAYVSEIDYGASLVMVFQFLTTTETDQSNLSASVKLQAQSAFSASATADVKSTFKQTLTQGKATAFYVAHGGIVIPPSLSAPEAFEKAVTFITSISHDTAAPIAATVSDYDSLVTQELPHPTPAELGDKLLASCMTMQDAIDEADSQFALCLDAVSHPEAYVETLSALKATQTTVVSRLKPYRAQLVKQLADYRDKIDVSKAAASVAVPVIAAPTLPAMPTPRDTSSDVSADAHDYYLIANGAFAIATQHSDGSGGIVAKANDPADPTQRWILRQNAGKTVFLNAASKQFLAMPGGTDLLLTQVTDGTSAAAQWILASVLGIPGFIQVGTGLDAVITLTANASVGWFPLTGGSQPGTNQVWVILKQSPVAPAAS